LNLSRNSLHYAGESNIRQNKTELFLTF